MEKSILIVDDDPDLVEIMKFELEAEKFIVDTAPNGKEALDKLRGAKSQVDLIILDINMPVMDGVDFFQEMKKVPEAKDIPVLVLTSSSELEKTFRQLDIADFISKPLSMGVFHYKVKYILANKKKK